jgi:hypothetical protein
MPTHYILVVLSPQIPFFISILLQQTRRRVFVVWSVRALATKAVSKARQGKARQGNSINIELRSKQCLHTTCLPSSILPPDFFFIPSMWLIHVVVVCYSLYFSKTRHYQPVQSVRHPYTFYGVARENCIVLLKLYFLCL